MRRPLSALLAEASAKLLALSLEALDNEDGTIKLGGKPFGTEHLGQLGNDLLDLSEQLEKAGR